MFDPRYIVMNEYSGAIAVFVNATDANEFVKICNYGGETEIRCVPVEDVHEYF